ncbi:MAG: hypothetical protein U1E53_29765 [Dongiaceae bacterium]
MARNRASSRGTSTRLLVSSITSMSIATSGPSSPRSAQSTAIPCMAASEFDGIIARHQRIT